MIFLIGNATFNYSICFPIFIIEDKRSIQFPYSMLLVFELILTFLSFHLVLKCAYVAARIRSFHRNLTVLLIIYTMQWFEGLASNILIKPYEVGYWSLGDYNEPIKQWWTDDPAKMMPFPDMFESPYFFLGGLIKWHYTLSLITTLLFVAIERSFACYFLNDYEKKSRNGLFFILICSQFWVNLIAAFCFFFNIAHFAAGLTYILSSNFIAMGIFSYVKNINNQVTRAIEDFSNPSTYCLPARFQARENMRCFQMISRVIISALCLIFIACFVNLVMYLELTPTLDPLLNLIFECAINLNPVIICPTLISSVDAWKKFAFSKSFCGRIKLKMRRRRKIKVSSTDGGVTTRNNKTKETDAYFDQLAASWI